MRRWATTADDLSDAVGRVVGTASSVGSPSGSSIAAATVLAVLLHRNGHARGDDFALYLRQARSLFDGNIAEVVADNRFAVINSTGAFSPYAYPWGLPLLLSPFVHLWDLDYDRLKLVEVAAFCVWLVLVHGIVRRRVGRVLALAVTAVMATAPAFLSHTGQLLSEFPHAAAVARGHLVARPDADAAGRCSTRRVARPRGARRPRDRRLQLPPRSDRAGRRRSPSCNSSSSRPRLGRRAAQPHAVAQRRHPARRVRRRRWPGSSCSCPRCCSRTTATTADTSTIASAATRACSRSTSVSARIPRSARSSSPSPSPASSSASGGDPGSTVRSRPSPCCRRSRSAPTSAWSGGTTSRSRRGCCTSRPSRSSPPSVLVVAQPRSAASSPCSRRCRCCTSSRVHAAVLPGDIGDARDFNRTGRSNRSGRPTPASRPSSMPSSDYTRPDDVIAFYRARTMTLYTDRRAFQTTLVDRISQRADYFAQQRGVGLLPAAADRGPRPRARLRDRLVRRPLDPLEGDRAV